MEKNVIYLRLTLVKNTNKINSFLILTIVTLLNDTVLHLINVTSVIKAVKILYEN